MTRKCVLCKETNYKNSYSFFSAPKDPETRKKWQNAIAIENYAVTDDTYVCSKHFHKDDIITHWVSGVPPHVITIKYKKCRLRPGAVPGRHLQENNQVHQECSDDSDINMSDFLTFKPEKEDDEPSEKKTFAIPRIEEPFRKSQNRNSNSMDTEYRFSSDFDEFKYIQKQRRSVNKTQSSGNTVNSNTGSKSEVNKSETLESSSQESCNVKVVNDTELSKDVTSEDDKREEGSQESQEGPLSRNGSESSRVFNRSDMDDSSTEMWEEKQENNSYSRENSMESSGENQLNTDSCDPLDTHEYSMCKDNDESEMLFEDLLEACSEIMLPHGWSCLVTSKGHTTTVVYLFMGMTTSGMPFVEKEVFVKSDMLLRCATVNREINPLIHNLIRDGKHLKVHNLLDLEELIDEFDQRTVCQGIFNNEELKEINGIKVAYKDGVRWRHILCPLILNNDSTRCTKCITLSHMLTRKAKNFLPFQYNPPIFTRKHQKQYSIGQIKKRTRKHDRRYDFIKVLKK